MRIREHLILRQVGARYMVIDPGKDVVDMAYVYTLNQTAAYLWEELKGQCFTTEIIAELLERQYDVSHEKARQDAVYLVKTMADNDLLENQKKTEQDG